METAKKRHRSPNYPAVGLRNAVERLRAFYDKDGKAGAPANIAAVHIGFSKVHGQAMSVLAALKKFGLVAESGGRFAPTQRGLEIVNLPDSDPRRQRAIQEAILEPTLYKELIEQHRETGWPSDEVLASELVTYRNFNPRSVGGFVRDLRDSLEFAGLSEESALESGVGDKIEMTDSLSVKMDAVKKGAPPSTVVRLFTWPLSKDVSAEVRLSGSDIKPGHLEMLRKYLDLAKDAWEQEEPEA